MHVLERVYPRPRHRLNEAGTMNKEEQIRSIEADLTFVQNEIDRRRERADADRDRFRNLEKIDELRAQKNELRERLAKLRES